MIRRASAHLVAICAGFGSALAFAHGDVHTQIANLDRQIAAEPQAAALYLRRAEFHRMHREWDAADRDFAKVIVLEPEHPEVSWQRARSELESGKAAAALTELNRHLKRFPTHPMARLTRARSLVALGRDAEAVGDFAVALEGLPQPDPDFYLEQLNSQRAAGRSPAEQLVALDKGLRRLGSVPSLEDAALDVEMRARLWDAGLQRLDRLAAASARKERWHYRRGLLLADAGRVEPAIREFRASLEAIDKLPPALRAPRATLALAEQVRNQLKKLGSD